MNEVATVVEPVAAAATEQAAPDTQEILDGMTPRQLDTWHRTGELPAKRMREAAKDSTQKSEDSSSSAAPGQETSGAAKADETSSDPESDAPRQEHKRKGARERITQLDTEIADLETRLARRAELRKQIDSDGKTDAKTAESSTVQPEKKTEAAELKETRPKPTIADKKPDGTAKYSDYEAFNEDLVDWKLEQRDAKSAFDKEQADKTAKKQAQDKANEDAGKAFAKRVEDFTKTHADMPEILKNKELQRIPSGSPLDQAILNRESGIALLHHIGTHPEELDRLISLPALDQAVEIGKLEATLSKSSESSNGPVPKKVSSAPKPATEVVGRGTPPADEVEAAIASNDQKAYTDALNRREIARRQGR